MMGRYSVNPYSVCVCVGAHAASHQYQTLLIRPHPPHIHPGAPDWSMLMTIDAWRPNIHYSGYTNNGEFNGEFVMCSSLSSCTSLANPCKLCKFSVSRSIHWTMPDSLYIESKICYCLFIIFKRNKTFQDMSTIIISSITTKNRKGVKNSHRKMIGIFICVLYTTECFICMIPFNWWSKNSKVC